MTQLSIAKSRVEARTETKVAFRGAVSNPDWPGMSVTMSAADCNGMSFGNVGAPGPFSRHLNARTGGDNTFGVYSSGVTGYSSQSPAFFIGRKCRVLRPINGVITKIRESLITSVALDSWTRIGGDRPITQTSFEFRFEDYIERTGTYRFGVAQIASNGQVGPISTVDVAVTGPTFTGLTPAVATNTGVSRSVAGRNPALPAITGLAASIRASTTHNILLTWNSTGTDEYVVFLNFDGTGDRFDDEATLTLAADGPPVLTNDMLIIESEPLLSIPAEWTSRRVRRLGTTVASAPFGAIFRNVNNLPGDQTWQYVAYDSGFPKPDLTYANHFLQIDAPPGIFATAEKAFHSGTKQSWYAVLTPGRIYRAEFVVAASAPVNARFRVNSTTTDQTVAVTTTPQTFTFDFSRETLLEGDAAQFWNLQLLTAGVSLKLLSIRFWDTTIPYSQPNTPLPANMDVRDHTLIKTIPLSLDSIISRSGSSNAGGGTLATLLNSCTTFDAYPHLQIEWVYPDEYYYDLVTFLCAPASSNEPLALKREALGFGPIQESFDRWTYEDGNERWNPIMRSMFYQATDSATGTVYGQGTLSAMFSAYRRAIMETNPYWPTVNPPIEFTGGWLVNSGYTVAAANFPEADYGSVALYTSGWDVNKIVLTDSKTVWSQVLTVGELNHQGFLQSILNGVANANMDIKMGVYEAGPGYQLAGLNGATVTNADYILQEVIGKSIGGTTAMMTSVAIAATMGIGPYNFFTWGEGPLWKAARYPFEGGGYYRVAAFLKAVHDSLGRCRVYSTAQFIDRKQPIEVFTSIGVSSGTIDAKRAFVFHFESLDYPGRHGIFYCNTSVNLDAFGSEHPDYQAGVTGSAVFRYHTGLPDNATPYKVIRNEGNFRHHDAYKIGFRKNVVDNVIVGYIADPLCVDLTVTLDDFTVTDPTLRELTLLGGNCRMELFQT